MNAFLEVLHILKLFSLYNRSSTSMFRRFVFFGFQDGTITNKQFRNLVLSVKEQAIIFVNGEEKIEGYGVGLAVKEIQRFLQEKKEGEGENL